MRSLAKSLTSIAEYLKSFVADSQEERKLLGKKIEVVRQSFHSSFADQLEFYEQKVLNLEDIVENSKQQSESQHEKLLIIGSSIEDLTSKINFNAECIDQTRRFQDEVKSQVDSNTERIFHLEKDIDKIKRDTLSSFYFHAPDKNRHFTGRREELNLLNSSFFKKSGNSHTLCICGLGGIGKSALASEFCWENRTVCKGGVFWISADNDRYFELSVSQLAVEIGEHATSFEVCLQQVLTWLKRRTERWLLVFDNLDQFELSENIRHVLDVFSRSDINGHILITTRRCPDEVVDTVPGITPNECLSLDCLKEEEGVYFLERRSGMTEEGDFAKQLVKELGGLPLGLEQAAAHIKAVKIPFSEYLKDFERQKLKLLGRKKAKPVSQRIAMERLTVRTTWMLNFEYLSKMSEDYNYGKAANTILEVAAFLGPDNIPVDIINNGRPIIDEDDLIDCLKMEIGQKEIVEILIKFSLFIQSSSKTLSIHRLVQEVIRDSRSEEKMRQSVLQNALRLMSGAVSQNPQPLDELKRQEMKYDPNCSVLHLWQQLCIHCSHLLEHIECFVAENPAAQDNLFLSVEFCTVVRNVSIYFDLSGKEILAVHYQSILMKVIARIRFKEEDKNKFPPFSSVTVPLKDTERNSLMALLRQQQHTDKTSVMSEKDQQKFVDNLKLRGAEAFNVKEYESAIEYYSEALRFASDESTKAKLYHNRSLCYFKLKKFILSLQDANCCVDVDGTYGKGYARRAYGWKMIESTSEELLEGIIYGKSDEEIDREKQIFRKPSEEFHNEFFPETIVSHRKSEAARINGGLAAYFDPTLRLTLEREFGWIHAVKLKSPNDYLVLKSPEEEDPNFQVVYLLKGGQYTLEQLLTYPNFRHVVGFPGDCACVRVIEREVLYGFSFLENLQLIVSGSTLEIGGPVKEKLNIRGDCLMRRCNVTGGIAPCAEYPNCDGQKGCKVKPPCSLKSSPAGMNRVVKFCSKRKLAPFPGCMTKDERSGFPGLPSIRVGFGKILMQKCNVRGSPSSGLLVRSKASVAVVDACHIEGHALSGIVVEDEGTLCAWKSKVCFSGWDGIEASRSFCVRIEECFVSSSKRNGITLTKGRKDTDLFKNCIRMAYINDTEICHNSQFGLLLDESEHVSVICNKVHQNGYWGMSIKDPMDCLIFDNNVSLNRCGGVNISDHNSERIIVAKNIIYNHNGPGLLLQLSEGISQFYGPITVHSSAKANSSMPYLLDNREENNNIEYDSIIDLTRLFVFQCTYCHATDRELMTCTGCLQVRYCNKVCQASDWKEKHSEFCRIFRGRFKCNVTLGGQFEDVKFNENGQVVSKVMFGSPTRLNTYPKPDLEERKKFIVKVEADEESLSPIPTEFNKHLITVIDRSTAVYGTVKSKPLFHLLRQCGRLSDQRPYNKTLYCFAAIREKNYFKLTIFYEKFAPVQDW